MNSKIAGAGDFHSPLPDRQFRGFLLFFHGVFLGALVLLSYTHMRNLKGPPASADITLLLLAVVQGLLYLFFFALPSLAGWPATRWFREVLGRLHQPQDGYYRPALICWGVYIGASVAVVLAESRIDPVFAWALAAYVGQISALRFRITVPATIAILGAYLLNRFGWSALAMWGPGAWLDFLVQVIPMAALVLFVGRMVVTSVERGKLIMELEATKRELEQARDREIELATLRERERLARDLHDNLGHSLVTLTVQLEAAQRLQAADPARVTAMLAEMQMLTRSSMEDLRRSLANLRAAGLGDRSLAEALQTLCAKAGKRFGADIDCQIAGCTDSLPPAVAEALWRVAQEGLTNIEKHAHAHHVEVNLAVQTKEIVLRINDDGIGLPSGAEDKPGHYGLRGLRERVEGLGGTFTVALAGATGTAITARIPVIA